MSDLSCSEPDSSAMSKLQLEIRALSDDELSRIYRFVDELVACFSDVYVSDFLFSLEHEILRRFCHLSDTEDFYIQETL